MSQSYKDEKPLELTRCQINERKAFVEKNRHLWVTHIKNHTPQADGTFRAVVSPSDNWFGGCFGHGEADVDENGDIVRMVRSPVTTWMGGVKPMTMIKKDD